MAGPWWQAPRVVNSASVLSPLSVLHRQPLVGELLVAHSLLCSLCFLIFLRILEFLVCRISFLSMPVPQPFHM